MLSEDKDLEYYRNRYDILEEENRQIKEKITKLEEDFAVLKDTVSAPIVISEISKTILVESIDLHVRNL